MQPSNHCGRHATPSASYRLTQAVTTEQARAALRHALAARRGTAVGSPLQEQYLRDARHGPVTARIFLGNEMEVVLPELVSCEVHRHGVIEPALTALFIEVVKPGVVVFDVGAHLGYYSLVASRLGGDVHAFEPARGTRSYLQRNVPFTVAIVPVGLWDHPGTLELKDFGPEHSAVNTFLVAKDQALDEPAATYPVPVTTLDRYVEESGVRPRLIKIDAEGAEERVLQGARRTIALYRPLITVEVGDTPTAPASRHVVELAAALGYAAYELDDDGLRPHRPRKTYSYGNVLLVPHGTEPPRLHALDW